MKVGEVISNTIKIISETQKRFEVNEPNNDSVVESKNEEQAAVDTSRLRDTSSYSDSTGGLNSEAFREMAQQKPMTGGIAGGLNARLAVLTNSETDPSRKNADTTSQRGLLNPEFKEKALAAFDGVIVPKSGRSYEQNYISSRAKAIGMIASKHGLEKQRDVEVLIQDLGGGKTVVDASEQPIHASAMTRALVQPIGFLSDKSAIGVEHIQVGSQEQNASPEQHLLGILGATNKSMESLIERKENNDLSIIVQSWGLSGADIGRRLYAIAQDKADRLERMTAKREHRDAVIPASLDLAAEKKIEDMMAKFAVLLAHPTDALKEGLKEFESLSNQALDKNILIVRASGNSSVAAARAGRGAYASARIDSMASDQTALIVGASAIDYKDGQTIRQAADFSSPGVDFVFPASKVMVGVKELDERGPDGQRMVEAVASRGTSFSAPLVAGMIAEIASYGETPKSAREIMQFLEDAPVYGEVLNEFGKPMKGENYFVGKGELDPVELMLGWHELERPGQK